jgi:hypothetical protein
MLAVLLLLLTTTKALVAQPYISLIGLTAWGMPGSNGSGIPGESYFLLNANLPLSIGKKNLILFTPFTERRTFSELESQDNVVLDGTGLFTNYVRYNRDSSRNVVLGVVIHNYSDGYVFNEHTYQAGGVLLYSMKLSDKLTIKPGMYYNKEFFSDYFLPLLGLDWRPKDDLKIFGVLPRLLVVEKKVSSSFYTGLRYRGLVNSYRMSESINSYIRYDNNQLAFFVEKYLFKHLVISVQAGISFYREIRSRNMSDATSIDAENSSALLKGGIYYRFRTD